MHARDVEKVGERKFGMCVQGKKGLSKRRDNLECTLLLNKATANPVYLASILCAAPEWQKTAFYGLIWP